MITPLTERGGGDLFVEESDMFIWKSGASCRSSKAPWESVTRVTADRQGSLGRLLWLTSVTSRDLWPLPYVCVEEQTVCYVCLLSETTQHKQHCSQKTRRRERNMTSIIEVCVSTLKCCSWEVSIIIRCRRVYSFINSIKCLQWNFGIRSNINNVF